MSWNMDGFSTHTNGHASPGRHLNRTSRHVSFDERHQREAGYFQGFHAGDFNDGGSNKRPRGQQQPNEPLQQLLQMQREQFEQFQRSQEERFRQQQEEERYLFQQQQQWHSQQILQQHANRSSVAGQGGHDGRYNPAGQVGIDGRSSAAHQVDQDYSNSLHQGGRASQYDMSVNNAGPVRRTSASHQVGRDDSNSLHQGGRASQYDMSVNNAGPVRRTSASHQVGRDDSNSRRQGGGGGDDDDDDDDDYINDNDVLCGGGSFANSHHGNKTFRALCAERKVAYANAGRDLDEKQRLINEVIDAVKASNGKFLRLDTNDGLWSEVSDEKWLYKKVTDALYDRPQIRYRNFWTEEQEDLLARLVRDRGTQWAEFSRTVFPGRSAKAIREKWQSMQEESDEE